MSPSDCSKAGLVGVRPFTHRVVVPASCEETNWEVMSALAPRLSDYGYELVTQSPTGVVFECDLAPALDDPRRGIRLSGGPGRPGRQT